MLKTYFPLSLPPKECLETAAQEEGIIVICGSFFIMESMEAVVKLQFGAKSALLPLDSDSPQVAYGQSDMSTFGEREPTSKSSNFAREASFTTAS
jgi:hypothetical protein